MFLLTKEIYAHRLAQHTTEEEDRTLLEMYLTAAPVYALDRADVGLAFYLTRQDAEAMADRAADPPVEMDASAAREAAAARGQVKLYGTLPISTTIRLSPLDRDAPVTVDTASQPEKGTGEPPDTGAAAAPPPVEIPSAEQADPTPPPAAHRPAGPPADRRSTESPEEEAPADIPVSPSAQPAPAMGEAQAPKEWKLVPEVRTALSTASTPERRKLDPSQTFENLHTLIGKLIQVNGLDMAKLDQALGLPPGSTRLFCTDLKSDRAPIKIVKKYLDYFHLGEYLYLFKQECSELARMLRESDHVDVYPIKRASNKTEEPFRLVKVRTAKMDGALIYQLILKSKLRKQEVFVSCPFGYVVGKQYHIEGLPPAADPEKPDEPKAPADILVAPKKGVTKQPRYPAQEMRRKGIERYMEETPQEKAERERGIVLSYIIRTTGCSARDAQKKFEPLAGYPAIVSEFARYAKTKKLGPWSSHGYNARRLIDGLHYSPYDAYAMLADLERDPKKTQELLKYRETDPQYQKTPSKKPLH